MPTVSVVTLAKGRSSHLRNVLRGLERQTQKPAELVVAVMQDAFYDLPEVGFPVRQIRVEGTELPLAAARNRGVAASTGEAIAFLDVDCIPTPGFVAEYAQGLSELDGLLMGEVLHLPEHATLSDWDYDDLARVAQKHSDRRGPRPPGSRSAPITAASGRSTSRFSGRGSRRSAGSTSAMSATVARTPISASSWTGAASPSPG